MHWRVILKSALKMKHRMHWMATLKMMIKTKHLMLLNLRTTQALLLFILRNQEHPLPVRKSCILIFDLFPCDLLDHTCPKIICSLHKLLQLVGQVCQVDGCRARREVDYKLTGCCITVFGICTSGHRFNWNSSDTLISQAGGMIYLDNLNFASALVLSGNNYRKIMVFARFYGLHIIEVTTFHGYQHNIICPAVDTFYKQEQVRILLQVVGCLFDFILLFKYRKNSLTKSKTKMLYCLGMAGVILLEKVQSTILIQLWISTLITYCTLKL